MELDFKVLSSPDHIKEKEIIIDSTFSKNPKWLRFDHHIDNGWTNLDSLCKADNIKLKNYRPSAIITSYLDPDAIISAAVLSIAIKNGIKIRPFLNTDISKIYYSASFWSDYGIACNYFPKNINSGGDKLELWLREKINEKLGEDRWLNRVDKAKSHTNVFREMAAEMISIIMENRFVEDVKNFKNSEYVDKMKKTFFKYIRDDLGTELFGVINIFGEKKRIVPRAYFSLFKQPMVIRVIQQGRGIFEPKQVFIGINPSQRGWETLNLIKLSKIIWERNNSWKLKGRRFVIGSGSIRNPIKELIDVLTNVEKRLIEDECKMWSVYR